MKLHIKIHYIGNIFYDYLQLKYNIYDQTLCYTAYILCKYNVHIYVYKHVYIPYMNYLMDLFSLQT